jgi:hypothetical protein
MKSAKALFRKVAVWLACIIVPLGVVYLFLAAVGLAWTPYTCIKETRQKISNLSGFDFEISETDCSTFGETASISIFVSTAGGHEKALLFKYGPEDDGQLLPSIVVSDRGNISISISEVADIVSQQRKWKNSSIYYYIGSVQFPVDREKKSE